MLSFIYIFCFSGPDSPYTKTALEIVNVCKQTLAEVLLLWEWEFFAVSYALFDFVFEMFNVYLLVWRTPDSTGEGHLYC